MNKTPLCSLAVLAALCLAPQAEPSLDGTPTMLRLRSGAIQWGEVLEHTPDGVVFKRLDTGGVVRLSWTFLDPTQERAMRTEFGYIDTSSEVLYVDADRLILVDGKEVTGLIVDQGEGRIRVKTESGLIDVPSARVRAVSGGVQVPALEVYTRDELIQKRLAEAPPVDAEALYDFGGFCEQILAFSHSLDAYEKAVELDPAFRAAEMPGLIARTVKKVEQQAQLEYLAEVDLLKRRKQFDEAMKSLTLFPDKFPNSPLEGDRLKLTKRVEDAQEDYVREVVQRGWYRWTERLAAQAARKMGFSEALGFAEEKLHQDVLTAVVDDAREWNQELEEDTVLQMWLERKVSRYRVASYGLGTWLLGEDSALAGSPQSNQAAESASEVDSERAALEEKIRKFLQSQKTAGRSSALAGEGDEDDVESFWKMLSSTSRSSWIVAYYAENSGDMEIKDPPELRNCPTCAGRGVIEMVVSDSNGSSGQGGGGRGGGRGGGGQESRGRGGLATLACDTCKGIGRIRRIRYR
jgi:tetratricopeptide (TPR) repeat protein